MVSTTSWGRSPRTSASRLGTRHEVSRGLDAGAIRCPVSESVDPSSEESAREGLSRGASRWCRLPLGVGHLEKQIIHPALLRGRERCTYPLPKQFPLSLGRPSRGLLLLPLPPVDGGQDGRGGLPTPSSTAPLLEAAADAVRERGWMQGAALGDEQAGRCNRRTGWGSSCLPRQEVLDRLSLLLCSRELLGHVTGCVGEEASLGYRNLEEPNFVYVLMSTRHSQKWRSWTTSVDIARPRDRAIPFVARGARSGPVRSSFRTSGSWPPPCMSLSAFSLKNLQ